MPANAPAQKPLESFVTTGEILRQPDIWRGFALQAEAFAQRTQSWLKERAHDEIWFCGAGSSSFIGDCLASYLNGRARTGALSVGSNHRSRRHAAPFLPAGRSNSWSFRLGVAATVPRPSARSTCSTRSRRTPIV